MLEGTVCGVRCRLSLLLPALLAGLLLAQPDGLAVTCIVASLMHETGHLAAMVAAGCPPALCTVGAFGVRLELRGYTALSYGRRIGISLAGPLVNGAAALVLLAMDCPMVAAVHGVLGCFNLLPAAALDGGQVLWCVCCMLGWEPVAERVLRWLSAVVLLPLATAAFWLCLTQNANPTLLIVSLYLTALIFFSPNM